jgi:hypothetical protein
MSDKLYIAKMIANTAVGISATKVANDIIRNNTDIETTADAAKVWIGSLVIGSMVAEHAKDHAGAKIDKVVNWWESRKTEDTAN